MLRISYFTKRIQKKSVQTFSKRIFTCKNKKDYITGAEPEILGEKENLLLKVENVRIFIRKEPALIKLLDQMVLRVLLDSE